MIDPKLIAPFVNSVRQVFATMVKVQTTLERPHLKSQPAPSYDVSGIIGFSGQITGSVVVSFQMQAATKLVEAFAGMALEPGTADFADAIGELANMIAGSAKKRPRRALASISVPNVIIGPGHVIARLSDVPCIVIPCKTPVGDFAVEINIKHVSRQPELKDTGHEIPPRRRFPHHAEHPEKGP
ncbi:MAG: chemotaxis protein CheX [Verrucomicrobiota bacterium]